MITKTLATTACALIMFCHATVLVYPGFSMPVLSGLVVKRFFELVIGKTG
ncbi:MAG: hypothetical protein PHS92_03085 [Candidatus Gracilibacteria bacterium]|nr:hypothetical protein [Candidatus Gracilibacteria bacterium]